MIATLQQKFQFAPVRNTPKPNSKLGVQATKILHDVKGTAFILPQF
jgi:hypothetical protein